MPVTCDAGGSYTVRGAKWRVRTRDAFCALISFGPWLLTTLLLRPCIIISYLFCQVVDGLPIDAFSRGKMDVTGDELAEELGLANSLLS